MYKRQGFQGALDGLRRYVADLVRVEVVAHDHVVEPGPPQVVAQAGHFGAGHQGLLDRVHGAARAGGAERHVVALRPAGFGEDVEGLVDGGAPGVDAVRGGGDDEGAAVGGVLLQPVGRLRPVRGQLGEGARLEHGAVEVRPGEPRQDQQRGERGGEPAAGHGAGAAPFGGDGRQMREAEGQREGQAGLELVDVPERPQPAVQPPLDGAVEGRAVRAAVPGQRDEHHAQHGQQQPAPLGQIAPGQAREAEGGGEPGADDRDEGGGGGPARGQPGLAEVEVGHPVPGAAQQLGRGHGDGGGVRLLDVRHEVVAVVAEQQQRHGPPGGGEDHAGDPPREQRALPGAARPGEQVQGHGEQRGERGGGVDAAHERDQQRGPGGGHPRARRPRRQRQQHPRQHRAGQGGGGRGPDDDGERGPQRVADGAEQPGRGRADAQPFGEAQRAPERGGDDERHPQPFGEPHRQPYEVGERVVGQGRERVADVLVGDAAEAGPVLPQRPEVVQEPEGVGDDAQFGLEGHPPRRPDQERDEREGPEPPQPPAAARRLGCVARAPGGGAEPARPGGGGGERRLSHVPHPAAAGVAGAADREPS